ncbi:MAG: 2OG-Fe(II) oxygenase [Candidatus Harrisonbacteria bacterium]|nr:2OG-Fe(II) oxygenase [Candidatus Harrisonbacteria bacterium]
MFNKDLFLLQKVTNTDVIHTPFPYFVIKNALPENIVSELVKKFPSTGKITKGQRYGSNERFDYTITDAASDSSLDSLWIDFLDTNSSDVFYEKIFELFDKDIAQLYPELSFRKNNNYLKKGIRYQDPLWEDSINFDCHISINTPVTEKPTSVRKVHVDDPKKLFGGLWYLRDDDDQSTGGDLELYEYIRTPKMFGQQVYENRVKKIKTVPYEKNLLIIFLNSFNSLHGVTIRGKTEKTRKFVNVVAELKNSLFDINSFQENFIERKIRQMISS